MVTPAGRRLQVEMSTVALRDGNEVVGVFGAVIAHAEKATVGASELSPRQSQVLALLAEGQSTDQMAAMLHLSRQTVRNHVRAVLRSLGVRSRLEAVVEAHRRNLI